MTTLSEYKAMMEGATDAPWKLSEVMGHVTVRDANNETVVGFSTYGGDCRYLKNARVMTASRNIAPELIRVIELAEIALAWYIENDETNEGDNTEIGGKNWDEENAFWIEGKRKAENALSEIRKLKGE